MKKAIFNADDFGLSEKINNGIAHGFSHGVLTDSSLVMTLPATQHALNLIKTKGLNAGVHLTLTVGKPLSGKDTNSVIHQGKFYGIGRLLLRIALCQAKQEDIQNEFRKQLIQFLDSGVTPTHLDTHQYIHMLPMVFDVVAALAAEYRIKALRIASEKLSLRFGYQAFQSIVVSGLSKTTRKGLTQYSLSTTDHFFGIARINTKQTLPSFLNIIKNIKPGTSEIMCHPGYDDPEIRNRTPYIKQRAEELKALTDPRLKELIKKEKIELISFRDL